MSSDKDAAQGPAYPGGFAEILSKMDKRRDPIQAGPGEGLPPLDVDFEPLKLRRVTVEETPGKPSDFRRKLSSLQADLDEAPELCLLNGLLIAHLRKSAQPDHTAALFQRLWAEEGAFLADHLDARWLVSSVTTFGDHGVTATQRSVGLGLGVLFSMMKLYEYERLYSGHPPGKPFALDGKIKAALPMQMESFALVHGGLDINTLGRLWREAEGDAVIRPLAHGLLERLIDDPAGLFRRLSVMRQRKIRRDAKAPPRTAPDNSAQIPPDRLPARAEDLRWGLVSTIRAPLTQIARFAAHHLELGASELHVFLDTPDPHAEAYLARDPRLRIVQCDDAYWQASGKTRMEAHQLRQAFNATQVYRHLSDGLHWLGHIDVDEFLMPRAGRMSDLLAAVPGDVASLRVPPAELLAPEEGAPRHFKLTHRAAQVPKAVVQDIYPTFGMHLYGGFLSHASGKILARPGAPDVRLGIHAMKIGGAEVTNRATATELYLGHFHAPSWDAFRAHLDFRRRAGSYRPREDRGTLDLSDLVAYLADEEGDEGLRSFFDEVCRDSDLLRSRLAAHGMLLTHPLDLDGAVRRVFGDMPGGPADG